MNANFHEWGSNIRVIRGLLFFTGILSQGIGVYFFNVNIPRKTAYF
jgi:hypothetical protein